MTYPYDNAGLGRTNGKISMEIAKDHAECEYEKYRIIQDKLYESDFDRLIMDAKK